MYSLMSIISIVLYGKDNWYEWHRKLKHTQIFNNLWTGVCDGDTALTQPKYAKKLAIWNMKNYKAYALISISITEEVNRNISSIDDA